MIIYKITNLVNGHMYIGLTRQPLQTRWKKHLKDSKHLDYYFYRAIKKYGPDNFTQEILEEISNPSKLDEKERYWINHYDTFKNGYNSTTGGEGGCTFSEAARRKMSLVKKGKPPNYIGPAWNKGIKMSPDFCKKMAEIKKGTIPTNLHILHSKECVEKMKTTKRNKYLERKLNASSNLC